MKNYRFMGALLAVTLFPVLMGCGGDGGSSTQEEGNSSTQSAPSLPDISVFQTHPTDTFLVDTAYITDGHPFKGEGAINPHEGAHLYIDNPSTTWPQGGTDPEHYPAIYAVADGTISKVDTYFPVGTNYRYGVTLAFAKKNGADVLLHYSIEPMTDPGDDTFYIPFLQVEKGQAVSKGDVLAYFYLPPGNGGNSHIHFHLKMNGANEFYAPDIFTTNVVHAFAQQWAWRGYDPTGGGGAQIPPCLGYLVAPDQDIFQ